MPGYIEIANAWRIVNVGDGPTPDEPSVRLGIPAEASRDNEQLPRNTKVWEQRNLR